MPPTGGPPGPSETPLRACPMSARSCALLSLRERRTCFALPALHRETFTLISNLSDQVSELLHGAMRRTDTSGSGAPLTLRTERAAHRAVRPTCAHTHSACAHEWAFTACVCRTQSTRRACALQQRARSVGQGARGQLRQRCRNTRTRARRSNEHRRTHPCTHAARSSHWTLGRCSTKRPEPHACGFRSGLRRLKL